MGLRSCEARLSEPALLRPVDVRELAEAISLRPSKRRGQNFVNDPNTVRRIVRIAGPDSGDHIVEIGPGLGSLTLGLLATGAHVSAIEIESALADQLPTTIASFAPEQARRFHLIHADAMSVQQLADPGPEQNANARERPAPAGDLSSPTMLVANLPYNVSVPVLLHMLETFDSIQSGLIMVQAEVADRLVAGPGSRTYGVPSVKTAWYGDFSLAGTVGRNVFWPVPNVDSALVSWRRRPPRGSDELRSRVFALADAAFAQRRKGLRASLAAYCGSADAAEQTLSSAGIDPKTRGEQLSIDAFITLAQAASPDCR